MAAQVVNLTGGIEIGGTTLYGMDAEQALKQAAKYDYGRERLIIKWVEETLGEKLPSKDLHEALKSGIILCRLLNCVKEGMIRKYNTRPIALMEMENIKLYLEGCWKLGIPSSCLFVSSDLYKARGMNEVLNNLEALSKLAARMTSYKGPILEIHERERGGGTSTSSGKSTSSGSATKKWKTIEMVAPQHVGELTSHEDVDIRSENLRLKQQLEREKCERMNLEEELEELKNNAPVAAPPKVVAPAVAQPAPVDDSKWKAQVSNLERRIQQLEQELEATKKLQAKVTTPMPVPVPVQAPVQPSNEKELKQLKQQLVDEQRLNDTTKRQ